MRERCFDPAEYDGGKGDRNARHLSLSRGIRLGCRPHQSEESGSAAAADRRLLTVRGDTRLRDRGRSQSIHEGSAKLLTTEAILKFHMSGYSVLLRLRRDPDDSR